MTYFLPLVVPYETNYLINASLLLGQIKIFHVFVIFLHFVSYILGSPIFLFFFSRFNSKIQFNYHSWKVSSGQVISGHRISIAFLLHKILCIDLIYLSICYLAAIVSSVSRDYNLPGQSAMAFQYVSLVSIISTEHYVYSVEFQYVLINIKSTKDIAPQGDSKQQ